MVLEIKFNFTNYNGKVFDIKLFQKGTCKLFENTLVRKLGKAELFT